MGAKRNRRELRAALESHGPVRLQRSAREAEVLHGFVVGLGEDWALLHQLYDVRLNGWAAVRLDTVASVGSEGREALAVRALRARGQRQGPIDVDLTSARTVIETMADALPLVALNREVLHPGESNIGRPYRFSKKRIHLQEVTTEATWELKPYALRLSDVTRVDAGGDYESALYQLAGDPPFIPRGARSVKAS